MSRQVPWIIITVQLWFAVPVAASSYIGTDLAFVHILKNKVPGSTADARPLFNLFYLQPINNYLLADFSIEYQWNTFTDGFLGALKMKGCIGLFTDAHRTLPTIYIGAAPAWLMLKQSSIYVDDEDPWYTYADTIKSFRNGFAMEGCAGFRHILGHNRFFSFGYTAEYCFLLPFIDITDVFIDEAIGLNCIKAGFSFTFRVKE